MPDKHPTYKQSCVTEALCEIHFDLPPSTEWKEEWYGDYFKVINENFPKMEPRPTVELSGTWGPTGFIPSTPGQRIKMIYKNKDRNNVIQLTPNILTINELKPYLGWDVFYKDIEYAWGKAVGIIKPAFVKRIGLRYINTITKEDKNEKIGDWLNKSKYYPDNILQCENAYFNRFEHVLNNTRRIITIGEPNKTNVDIVLDIDVILEKQIDLTWANLLAQFETLHELCWDVFSSSLTQKLKKKLET